MKRTISLTQRPVVAGLLIVLSLIIAACSPSATGGTSYGGGSSGGSAPSGNVTVSGSGTVRVANSSQLGQILVTPDGKTLYTNTVDTPQSLRCIDVACTGLWKPYTVDAQPTADQVPGSLQLINRPDGSKQVTYNQQPLYTFYLDAQLGDAKGNGFTDFGGAWHVVTLASSSGASGSGSGGSSAPYGSPY